MRSDITVSSFLLIDIYISNQLKEYALTFEYEQIILEESKTGNCWGIWDKSTFQGSILDNDWINVMRIDDNISSVIEICDVMSYEVKWWSYNDMIDLVSVMTDWSH